MRSPHDPRRLRLGQDALGPSQIRHVEHLAVHADDAEPGGLLLLRLVTA
jgi:hypothetical protein